MTEAKVRVDVVMGEIERDVRARLRRHLLKKGGAADYQDEEIFAAVHALLARPPDASNLDAPPRSRSGAPATSTAGCSPTSRSRPIVRVSGASSCSRRKSCCCR